MNKEKVFAIWSPETSLWSTWAKPVLFAHLDTLSADLQASEVACDVSWVPSLSEKTALVLDLPGPDGVYAGVELANRGYRPIPLYNAVPLPCGEQSVDPLTGRTIAAVNVLPTIQALRKGSERLAKLILPPDAPPAFLLDANRHGGTRKMQPEEFDNRSVCFTTDFPSANFLLAHGIRRALVIQKDATMPQADLSHTLKRWQDGGLALESMRLDVPARSERLEWPNPSWYGAMFQRALSAFGLRRAAHGGFGAWVPESSAGG